MSDLDEIKSRINIVDLINPRVTLKKAGRHYKGLCPFHNEKSPSFVVSPERQTWHCFGCGKGGSIFDFIMEYDHVDFVEALQELADKAGVKLERQPAQTQEGKVREQIYAVNHLASEYYHYLLVKHALGKPALAYLKNRDISDKSIETFSLGYSPNSWDGVYKFLRKKGYSDELLETAGLIIHGSRGYYDRFRGRVMFTLNDHRGNVVGFAGRLLDSEAKEAKYINTSETPVYLKSQLLYGLDVTKSMIQKAGEAVVMEGEIDVISSFQAGVSNVVAIKGSALTEGHIHLLRRFTERVVFALDSDLAGDAAARRGIELADKAGLDMKVIQLPAGKDPDEAARTSPGLFKKSVEDAMPIYDYFVLSASRRFDAKTAYGKKKIGEELVPMLAKIENSIVQGHYVKEVAKVLDISESLVMDSIRKYRFPTTSHNKTKEKQASTEPASREDRLTVYILALLLQGKPQDRLDELIESISLADLTHPAVRQILELLGAYLQNRTLFLVKDFADTLPKELLPTLDEAFLWDLSAYADDEEQMAREWLSALRELRVLILKRKIKTASAGVGNESDTAGADIHKQLSILTLELKAIENAR